MYRYIYEHFLAGFYTFCFQCLRNMLIFYTCINIIKTFFYATTISKDTFVNKTKSYNLASLIYIIEEWKVSTWLLASIFSIVLITGSRITLYWTTYLFWNCFGSSSKAVTENWIVYFFYIKYTSNYMDLKAY